jgi:serine/threonine-protein kinase
MVTSELGACEWFVWDLRRSNLIDRGRLDQIIGEFLQKKPRAEPPELAEYLVEKGILTSFQSERLLAGKTQGFVLGPFTLMDALGTGSMGTVYKAQSKTDNQWYAVKVLPRRSMWNVRIARRKVRAFEQARHPSVVPFVDVGTAGGMHYLAWPHVEGETLDRVVQRQGPMPSAQVVGYGLQIAEGLEVCHQQGLIHGLLKPSNVMAGPNSQIYILDFGIGCLLAETEGESLVDTMSTANAVTSGLDCASPESIMEPNNLTPTGDQYSLGCTFYYLLTGQYPFQEGSAAEKMMAHQFKEPAPISQLNPDVPADLVVVVERLMKKAPEARYGSTGELVEALRAIGGGIEAAHGSAAAARSASPKRNGVPASPATVAPTRSSAQVSASSPTPKPTAMGTLPTRNSIRTPGQAAQTPVPEPKAKAATSEHAPAGKQRVIPGALDDQPDGSWDDRLGPIGIAVSALVACGLVYAVAVWLQLF